MPGSSESPSRGTSLLPNFVVIGAAKGGTTSLHRYLSAHPDVYMSPVKEPSFFAYEGHALDFRGPKDQLLGAPSYAVTTLPAYEALFAARTTERAIGEASPFYLCIDGVAERMAQRIPDAKLIAVLRDPAERAFSNYVMFLRDRRETLSFRRALAECEARRRAHWAQGWQYVDMGFYARQLRRFYAVYPAAQIKVCFYEDLDRDPRGFVRDVLSFLGVDPTFTPNVSERLNVSAVKRRRLDRLVNRTNPLRSAARVVLPASVRGAVATYLRGKIHHRPQLAPRDRAFLIDVYRDDILELQHMTGRDLTAWLT